MIKNGCLRRISLATFALVLVLLGIYLFPQNDIKFKTETIHQKVNTQNIYLIDKNNYVATIKTNIDNYSSLEDKAYEVIEALTKDSNKSKFIPSSFSPSINKNTKINNINIDEGLISVDFNQMPFDDSIINEEKTIESIVFSLTEISGIDKVLIKVNGEIMDKLPSSGKILNYPLTRSIGINRKSNINSFDETIDVTTYFINYDSDNNPYFIPVTLTTSGNKEKIEVIIEELSGKDNIDPNLKTYLEAGTILKNYQIKNNEISLDFNTLLLNGFNKISEEVIYGLSSSIKENYHVDTVFYYVNDKKISSYTFKTT